MNMPPLETARLRIRPFILADLDAVYQLFNVDLVEADLRTEKMASKDERFEWLRWSVLNYDQLAKLYQPPYGDRAIVLKSTGQLIGSCGYVPLLMPFEQIPGLASDDRPPRSGLSTTEFGLFYAISPAHRRHGYASEAAQALVEYAFQHLRLKRVVATTTHNNIGSMGVMRRLGMRVERNPLPEPHWMQVVGVIENPAAY